jgi:hypothetical protein
MPSKDTKLITMRVSKADYYKWLKLAADKEQPISTYLKSCLDSYSSLNATQKIAESGMKISSPQPEIPKPKTIYFYNKNEISGSINSYIKLNIAAFEYQMDYINLLGTTGGDKFICLSEVGELVFWGERDSHILKPISKEKWSKWFRKYNEKWEFKRSVSGLNIEENLKYSGLVFVRKEDI